MVRRYEGFSTVHGLIVLDTFTGKTQLHPFNGMDVVSEQPQTALPNTVQVTKVSENAVTQSLDDEVVATFPYPIARAWKTYLEEADPRIKCKLLVDAFTALLKYWALIVASEYLLSSVQSASVNRSLVRDIKRPLISTWNLLL